MAITFEELKAIADGTDLKKFCDPEKQVLLFLGLGDVGVCHLFVRLLEEGKGIHFHVPYIATVPPDHPHLTKALLMLLAENHRVKIGRFCYDLDDGEVYLDWFLPVEDGTLTSHQLARCLKTLMVLADEAGVRLKHLLETGGDLPEERRIEGMLRRLLSGGLSEEAEVRLRRLFQDLEASTEENEEDEPKG
jgi:hypothetical protein